MTMGDILVLSVIGLVAGLIIAGMVRDKKRGKTCGGCSGCSGCTSCSACAHCTGCPGHQK